MSPYFDYLSPLLTQCNVSPSICLLFYNKKKIRRTKCVSIAACQCYGHTTECVFDEDVEAKRLSIDIHGNYDGGGFCQNCQVTFFFCVCIDMYLF
jgi:laminin alpha 3/5